MSLLLASAAGLAAQDKSLPDSPKGFEKQYKLVVDAYKKGDNAALEAGLQGFAIPQLWFTDTFGPEEGQELASTYAGQFEDFRLHVSRSLKLAEDLISQRYKLRPTDLVVETSLSKNVNPNPAPKPPPDSVLSLPALERFETRAGASLRGQAQWTTSWMDSFVYLEGRFRFLGRGAYPFWDAADVRRADPCAKRGEGTGGKLISRVEPVYPEEAKQKRVEGVVRARLSIAKDGSVSLVEIISGDPLLVDAAKQAMMQWRYTPFMNCGEPVEMRSIEHVKFTLS